jgi:hypothetical protein
MRLLFCTPPSRCPNSYLVRHRVYTTTTGSTTDLPLFSSAWLTPKPSPPVRLHLLYSAPFAPPLRPPYSSACIPRAATGDFLHDAGATAALIAGAYALVFTFDLLTQRNLIPQVQISFFFFWIKLVHIYIYFDQEIEQMIRLALYNS